MAVEKVTEELAEEKVEQPEGLPIDVQVEGEEGPRTKYSVKYTHWAPLSKQRSFVIPADWLVTIYDPHDNILKDYCLKNNIELESDKESPMAPPPAEVPETTVEAA